MEPRRSGRGSSSGGGPGVAHSLRIENAAGMSRIPSSECWDGGGGIF